MHQLKFKFNLVVVQAYSAAFKTKKLNNELLDVHLYGHCGVIPNIHIPALDSFQNTSNDSSIHKFS